MAKAAPEPMPKRVVATAMATSKWLLEPMRVETMAVYSMVHIIVV